jgi:hypothetical protein
LRAALAVPVLVIVVVGALFSPALGPEAAHRQAGQLISRPSLTRGDVQVSRPHAGPPVVDPRRAPFGVPAPQ